MVLIVSCYREKQPALGPQECTVSGFPSSVGECILYWLSRSLFLSFSLSLSLTHIHTHTHTHTHTTELEDDTTSASSTLRTTPTPPTTSSPSYDIYYIIGIGIFVVVGIALVVLVILIIGYCCYTKQTSNRKTKKNRTTTSEAGVELAVGTTLSFPSPQVTDTKRRESSSVSTDANSSSTPVSEGTPRTTYSSTSV